MPSDALANRDVPRKIPVPDWWNPAGMIAWLQSHPGGTITQMCGEAADFSGRSPKSLHRDVSRLRRKEPALDEALVAYVMDRQGFLQRPRPKTLDEKLGPNWRQDFADAIMGMEVPSYMRAAEAIGVDWSHLRRKADPEHENYDEQWAKTLQFVQDELLARCTDNVLWGLHRAREKDDPKTVIQGSISVLERLEKDKWSRQVETKGRVDHVHKIAESTRLAMEQAAYRSRKMFQKDDPAEPIEVEVVDES